MLVRGQRETLRQAKPDEMNECVWFHAASVGEFEQARPIIERLRREQPNRRILLTFFSPSGYEMRKDYNQVDYGVVTAGTPTVLPVDFDGALLLEAKKL